jgi:hypothetical protein
MPARRTPAIASPPERPRLTRPREDARALIVSRVEIGRELESAPISGSDDFRRAQSKFHSWDDGNAAMLRQLFTTDEVADNYSRRMSISALNSLFSRQVDLFRNDVALCNRRLEGVIEQLQFMEAASPGTPAEAPEIPPLERLLGMLSRFHRVVLQLRVRQRGRSRFIVADEYDVQDLLHALLKIDFADVRAEEWTPSYAGGAARMDFLLRPEGIVLEAKKTREGLGERELGDQLIVDIARHASHPSCRTLVCFVYDPEGAVRNAEGLRADLEALGSDHPSVRVVVTPA